MTKNVAETIISLYEENKAKDVYIKAYNDIKRIFRKPYERIYHEYMKKNNIPITLSKLTDEEIDELVAKELKKEEIQEIIKIITNTDKIIYPSYHIKESQVNV